jgi:hypothetical protein
MRVKYVLKRWSVHLSIPLTLAPVWLLVLAVTPAQADWPNNNPTKYYQPPDLTDTGYNVLAAEPPAGSGQGLPLILADDFPCHQTGPITDIHIWASWLGDAATTPIPPIPITLGIWSDVPATNGPTGPVPSQPGVLLWQQTFIQGGAVPGHYKVVPKGWAPSPFWDPEPPPAGGIKGTDNILWQYNFYPDPANLFVQQGTAAAPTNYWLSVTVGANSVAFGWRTSPAHYGDDAVFGHMNNTGTSALNDWQELFDPLVPTKSLNLAFALTTTPQTPPPPPPSAKWVQYPDLQSGLGLDVNATSPNAANGLTTLADDFQCTVAGPITNIQVWGSFYNDLAPGANTFVVSIWSDSAPSTAGFSQPFQRLWSQTYGPGDYTYANAGTGTEHFFDEFTGLLSPETKVWLYNFDLFPTNPFCQQGQGKIYWLSVASLSPPAAFLQWGWKTSTNHLFDAGVYGKVDPVSGNLLVGWQPLSNPLLPTPTPIDFAFRISSGPPDPNCDPALSGAGAAPPDTSTNGLDVWARTPTVVGDDFLCQVAGQISGFTIWGSWLDDQVDTNAAFQVGLWTDVPAVVGQSPFSHPGSLVCSSLFYPPQTPQSGGAAVLRYQYRQYAANLQEQFYNPNVPGLPGLMGSDTQIWRYDFFPFVPSCFVQDGGPFANGRTYWLTVSYLPQTPGGGNYVFGWKTSTRHWQDAAVFGASPTWNPMFDPRTGAQLDLAKVIWKFPVTGINKDMVNTTTSTATGIQIILSGPHLITWHYDGSGPWLNFLATTNAAGDTVLQWSGGVTVPPGGITHVGFETPGSVLPPILGLNWLSGSTVIGPALQVNMHLLGDPILVLANDFSSGPVIVGNSSVEFYSTPPPLDQMVLGGQRSPLHTNSLTVPQGFIMPGSAGSLSVPAAPAGAQYALFLINLEDSSGRLGAMDFALVPLDVALAPIIQSYGVSGSNVTIGWSSVYGRNYQLQSKSTLGGASSWGNVGSPVMAVGGNTSMTTPVGGNASFYRVVLMP